MDQRPRIFVLMKIFCYKKREAIEAKNYIPNMHRQKKGFKAEK